MQCFVELRRRKSAEVRRGPSRRALKLCDIVEIGLGGYVIGRSAEKVLPGIVESLK
jgi:hypothetical protein